jgi:hypothetical protein
LLNRTYKPVGWKGGDAWADYDTWPEAFDIALSPEQVAALSWNGDANTARVYLYNDGCSPWTAAAHDHAYQRRLAILADLGVGS